MAPTVSGGPSADSQLEPQPGVLMLANGGLMAGLIEECEGFYRVHRDSAVLQVPADQVELRCGSVNDAYFARRQTRGGFSADSHVALAQWCLRNELLAHAKREIDEVRVLDARHAALSALEIQLQQMTEFVRAPSEAAIDPSSTTPVASNAASVGPHLAATAYTVIPREARAQFVRSIQPMLIRNCATGGCHQPATAMGMPIDRWAIAGRGNAELVRHNLAAVLAHVDRRDPTASELIRRARVGHGGPSGSMPLSAHQTTMLTAWVRLVAGQQADSDRQSETTAPPIRADNEFEFDRANGSQSLPEPFTPRDVFDADIFNRRQQAERAEAGEVDVKGSTPLKEEGPAATSDQSDG